MFGKQMFAGPLRNNGTQEFQHTAPFLPVYKQPLGYMVMKLATGIPLFLKHVLYLI